jgi:hypothetical protein
LEVKTAVTPSRPSNLRIAVVSVSMPLSIVMEETIVGLVGSAGNGKRLRIKHRETTHISI